MLMYCFKNHGFENEGFENEGFNEGFEVGILRQAQDKFFIFRRGLRRLHGEICRCKRIWFG